LPISSEVNVYIIHRFWRGIKKARERLHVYYNLCIAYITPFNTAEFPKYALWIDRMYKLNFLTCNADV
jgi:hypothetical protein